MKLKGCCPPGTNTGCSDSFGTTMTCDGEGSKYLGSCGYNIDYSQEWMNSAIVVSSKNNNDETVDYNPIIGEDRNLLSDDSEVSLSLTGEHKYEKPGWDRILVTDPLVDSTASSISVKFDWKDQGWGNRKGKVRIILLSDDKTTRIAQKEIRVAPHEWETKEDTIDSNHDLITLFQDGYSYAVEVMAGWGSNHLLYLRDFNLQVDTNPTCSKQIGDRCGGSSECCNSRCCYEYENGYRCRSLNLFC